MSEMRVTGLHKAFGPTRVLTGLDLYVAERSLTAVLGPSGCGKTTLLRLIAGFGTPDAGEIWINGTRVSWAGGGLAPERRSVGIVPQEGALFPHLSVARNVAFGLPAAGRAARTARLLERVGLARHAGKYPHQLSGGEQQRVALARALAPRPPILLMDEPFSSLDNRLRDGIRDRTLDLLKEEGTGVLLVTHEPDEAMRMADEIALMRAGRIVQRGAPYNVYNAPVDKAAAAFFSDVNVIRGVSRGALTETPFGAFLTPGHADGGEVEIVIRPQHLRIDFDRGGRGPNPTPAEGVPARGTVLRSRYLGRESLVDFAMDFEGAKLTASVPGVFLPKPGTVLWLMIRRDRCFVFGV
jgi:iron(III) transport system ATP-binding protein